MSLKKIRNVLTPKGLTGLFHTFVCPLFLRPKLHKNYLRRSCRLAGCWSPVNIVTRQMDYLVYALVRTCYRSPLHTGKCAVHTFSDHLILVNIRISPTRVNVFFKRTKIFLNCTRFNLSVQQDFKPDFSVPALILVFSRQLKIIREDD